MKTAVAALLAALVVTACGGAEPGAGTVESQRSKVIEVTEAATIDIPTLTATQAPSMTATLTQTTEPTWTVSPCNPEATYCVSSIDYLLDRPIAPPGTNTIDRGYPYGSTEYNTREAHHGVEFVNPTGTPVLAAADGKVIVAGDDSQKNYAQYPGTYGNLVVIEHHFEDLQETIFTLYGHLSRVDVQVGQTVQQGDVIGQVGSSGEAIGSHLHFEVREGRNDYASTRNPVLWFEPLKDETGVSEGIIAGRLEDSQGQPIYAGGINIQYFPDPKGPQAMAWQAETYAPAAAPLNGSNFFHENFSLGDMRAGNYRVSLMWGGKLVERWIYVNPDCITSFTIRINP